MAVDLRIEVFSVDLYRNLWYRFGLKDFVIPRLKNYDNVTTDKNTCSEAVLHAVECRQTFFSSLLWGEIYVDYEEYSKSSLDFYLYLENNMDKFLPYSELNIFDKLFMVCAVILEMGYASSTKSNNMYMYNSPLCFAMYFDTKYKEEFYSEGGWSMLDCYASTYKSRVLTHPINKISILCIRTAYNEAILTDYSFDRVNRAFIEKSRNRKSKASCPQCLPLFHIIRVLSCTSEFVTEFQLIEGYLQLILRMLSRQELLEEGKHHQGTKFEQMEKVIKIADCYFNTKIKQKSDETIPDESLELLCRYKDQNTNSFLARLFQAHGQDGIGDQCMFCARNISQMSKVSRSVSDIQIKRIKSMIHDTVIDVKLKGDESTEMSFKANNKKSAAEKDSDNKGALKLFFSLGVEPLKSNILKSLEKTSKNQTNMNKLADSLAKIKIDKASDYKVKENTGKIKRKKNKNYVTNCDQV
ncbi:uncharacterized protein [Parasteatoda tepidariorum]|uniref:uncharacterized protein n=1 Tax=Parasteatoda tepidariorum TaxID=114398 RepID=UPI0039BCCB01